MAVDISKLVSVVKQKIDFDDLSGKGVAIDAFNTIYQFLSIIRQPDGTPLRDEHGRVTSHLSGLLYRTSNFLEYGISPVFVFDGIPPVLKERTLQARASRRREAERKWEAARAEGMLAEARAYAMVSTKINKEIIDSSKELLELMGIPYVQAPSEGEAQAASMVRDGLVYASASQDYDSFLFGADIVIRNFALSGRRKLQGKNVYVNVELERIELESLLGRFGISRRQLVWIGMMIGTDFNSGIRGIGPMTALKIAKSHASLREITAHIKEKYGKEFDSDPEEVERLFLEPEVTGMSMSDFNEIGKRCSLDEEALVDFMCREHGFSEERIRKSVEKLSASRQKRGQRGIGNWM